MQSENVINYIKNWLSNYIENTSAKGFVIGISGGIDSAVTSTLCALTQHPLSCIEMPIHQDQSQVTRAQQHIAWLQSKFDNVTTAEVNLTDTFESFRKALPETISNREDLALANSRARLRMTTLYYWAGLQQYIVVGTGNKVEDFGVGFYTKYGDGGVDLSPIADLMKSDVYSLAEALQIIPEIQNAAPTDGLFGDSRTDEDQLGATYDELEWAMMFNGDRSQLEHRQAEVLAIYERLNAANEHKMKPIPVCEIPQKFK